MRSPRRLAVFLFITSGVIGCELVNDLAYLRGPPVSPSDGGGDRDGDGGVADVIPFDGPDSKHLNGIVQLGLSGTATTCARRADDKLFCWGLGSRGELAIPVNSVPEVEADSGERFSSKPLDVTLTDPVKLVRGGGRFFCAVDSTNRAVCWGYNGFCALGRGTCDNSAGPPATVSFDGGELVGVDDLGLGPYHACAHVTTGSTVCWGNNTFLQTGVPSTVDQPVPDPTTIAPNVSSLVAGAAYSCGIKPTGEAQCWGNNADGLLGGVIPDGGAQTASPINPVSGTKFLSLAGGYEHVCGIDTSNQVWCWGKPDRGATGNLGQSNPHKVTTFPGTVKQLAAGNRFTCGLLADGRVACMGANELGQLGNGQPDLADHATPAVVPNLTGVSALVAGYGRTCAISQGFVWCWGSNALGALGDGTTTDRPAPTQVVAP